MHFVSTKEALLLKEALERLGIRVLAEVDDGHKHIDLTIPSARINIEVDGERHLTDPYQILADLKRSHYSDDLGYDTIHISNDAIHTDVSLVLVVAVSNDKFNVAVESQPAALVVVKVYVPPVV